MNNYHKRSIAVLCIVFLSVLLASPCVHADLAWPWTAGDLAQQAAANRAAADNAEGLLKLFVYAGLIGFAGCAAYIRHLYKNRTIVEKVIKNEVVQRVVKQEVIVRTPAQSLAVNSVVIDGLNVIFGAGANNTPNLLNLVALLRELQLQNYSFKCYFDPGTFYTLKRTDKDQAYAYRRLLTDYPQYFTEVPPCEKADDYILDYAHSHGTPVISNDRYRDFEDKYSWIKTDSQRRVAFINDTQMVQVLPLGIQAIIPKKLSDAEKSLRMAFGKIFPSATEPAQDVRPFGNLPPVLAHA